MKTLIELPKELAEFEAIYRELLIKETLELVNQIKLEYINSLNLNRDTMEVKGYLMKEYGKSVIKEVLIDRRDNQYFIDKCTKQSLTPFTNLLNLAEIKETDKLKIQKINPCKCAIYIEPETITIPLNVKKLGFIESDIVDEVLY